jgi:UDP-4-amino-4,6-dideoxy-N-acetyl-beta-L-altrosamine N-acetyltransferase
MLKYISLKEEHAKLVFTWRLMPHVTKFMLSDIDEDLEKHKKWVKSIINNKNCQYWLILFEDQYIGLVDLSEIDYINKRCTVGYYIGEKEFVGLGALFLPPVYDYVFNKLRLNKIYGEVLEGNDKILGIHKYHAWRNVGVYKNHVIKSGKYFDVNLVELLSTDWKNYRKRKANKEIFSVFKSYELFE